MSSQIAPAEFRRAMASFATGITVIAVDGSDGVHAMTASAFMSGSLAPPLVVLCVDRKSRMHDLLLGADRFGVSVLNAAQQEVSSHFANQARAPEAPRFSHQWGAPVLQQALTRIVAAHESHHDCGDHTLFVGRVEQVGHEGGPPLLHFGGRYHRLAGLEPATA